MESERKRIGSAPSVKRVKRAKRERNRVGGFVSLPVPYNRNARYCKR